MSLVKKELKGGGLPIRTNVFEDPLRTHIYIRVSLFEFREL